MNDLAADRTSCSSFLANCMRWLLHAAAYILHQQLRSQALRHTALLQARPSTVIAKLFKIVLHLPSACLVKHVLQTLTERLCLSRPAREQRIEVTTGLAPDGAVRVAIRDSGAVLTGEGDDHLYRPIYTTKPDGLGLGLSICRSVIEAHAGRLWHDSHEGGGTTFQFTLPGIGD